MHHVQNHLQSREYVVALNYITDSKTMTNNQIMSIHLPLPPNLESGHHLLHFFNESVNGDPPDLLHVLHQLKQLIRRRRDPLDALVNRRELLVEAVKGEGSKVNGG